MAISPPRTNRFKLSEQYKFGESSQDYCLGSYLHIYNRDLPDDTDDRRSGPPIGDQTCAYVCGVSSIVVGTGFISEDTAKHR